MTVNVVYSIFEKCEIFTCSKASERLYIKLKSVMSNIIMHEFIIFFYFYLIYADFFEKIFLLW